MEELSLDPVGKYRPMDRATEDLLFSGLQLRNGMIVIGGTDVRVELIDSPDEGKLWDIMLLNRWCVVSDLVFVKDQVSFIATYADGNKVKRVRDAHHSWYVKKDSISVEKPEPTHRIVEVAGIVTTRIHLDGKTSVFITEENGNTMEFVVADSTMMQDEGMNVLANKIHDPSWAVENLMKKQRATLDAEKQLRKEEAPFEWLKGDTVERPEIQIVDVRNETVQLPTIDTGTLVTGTNGEQLRVKDAGSSVEEWLRRGADDQPQD